MGSTDRTDAPQDADVIDLDPPPVRVISPDRQLMPFVYNSPHSGQFYPEPFLAASCLNQRTIRRSEDFLVDALMAPVVEMGATLVKAIFPRAYVDVNREPYELDPKMFDDHLPPFANSRSLRVAGGLGTVPRVVADGQEIYAGPQDLNDALSRIDRVYRPYHEALRRELARTHVRFGYAILVDCHSMPSNLGGHAGRQRPDFVVGDRYGTSCAGQLVDCAISTLRGLGYSVSRNKPYAGGFITEHYGRPSRGLHAVQIEINRSLYMEEGYFKLHSGFADVQASLMELAAVLSSVSTSALQPSREAAE